MGRPIEVNGKTYKDSEYTDVILNKLATSVYQITNDGEYKDKVVYYDIEDSAYYETDYNKEQNSYSRNDNIFDISQVSSSPRVIPTLYDHLGAEGKGVGFVETKTTLRTTGLNTCVGWLLYNDNAAYLTHIVVDYPDRVLDRVLAKDSIASQVQKLYTTFSDTVGSPPTHVRIQVDKGQFAYEEHKGVWQSGWMKELVPNSCKAEWIRGDAVMSHEVLAKQGTRKEWVGAAILLEYSPKT